MNTQRSRRVEIIGLIVGLFVILGVASTAFWHPWERDIGVLVSWVLLAVITLVALIGLGAAARELVVVWRMSKRRKGAQHDG